MSNSNICKIKGNKNSWKMSVKKMHKVHNVDWTIIRRLCKTQHEYWGEQKGVQVKPISLVKMGEWVKRNKRKNATWRDSAPPPKIFHHNDTTGCLRMAGQLLPKQSLPSRALPRIHLSATFLCAAGLLQANFSSLASWTILAITCPYLNS